MRLARGGLVSVALPLAGRCSAFLWPGLPVSPAPGLPGAAGVVEVSRLKSSRRWFAGGGARKLSRSQHRPDEMDLEAVEKKLREARFSSTG